MSYEQPTWDELAFHEAGHAYAFASLVRFEEPVELGLSVDAAGQPRGWCRRTSLFLAGARPDEVQPDVLRHLMWQSYYEIIIAMAGPVAEFRRRHRSRSFGLRTLLALTPEILSPKNENVDGDFSRVRSLVEVLAPGDGNDLLSDLIRDADAIVSLDWRRIGLLAERLAQTGSLGEDELYDWFARHPAVPHAGRRQNAAN